MDDPISLNLFCLRRNISYKRNVISWKKYNKQLINTTEAGYKWPKVDLYRIFTAYGLKTDCWLLGCYKGENKTYQYLFE